MYLYHDFPFISNLFSTNKYWDTNDGEYYYVHKNLITEYENDRRFYLIAVTLLFVGLLVALLSAVNIYIKKLCSPWQEEPQKEFCNEIQYPNVYQEAQENRTPFHNTLANRLPSYDQIVYNEK